jgi:hypothetical protein
MSTHWHPSTCMHAGQTETTPATTTTTTCMHSGLTDTPTHPTCMHADQTDGMIIEPLGAV